MFSIFFALGCRDSIEKTSEIPDYSDEMVRDIKDQTYNDARLTIGPLDVNALFEARNKVIIINIRPLSSYETSYITGALSIPITELENRLAEVPKNKQIIYLHSLLNITVF
jgi:hypothetical protein